MMLFRSSRAFTLIELLIVVAIIAILAAIAVPNFLEAQVRSKVSRARSDMRSLATALESYVVDHSHYPPDRSYYYEHGVVGDALDKLLFLHTLTTPIAYMTSIPPAPWKSRWGWGGVPAGTINADVYSYLYYGEAWVAGQALWGYPNKTGLLWALVTFGPDGRNNQGEYLLHGMQKLIERPYMSNLGLDPGCVYDPTNGTVSAGDIVRVGP